MTVVFVAFSKQLSLWGADVGLGKHLFLLSVAADADAAAGFLKDRPCGAEDWVLLKQEDLDVDAPEALQAKLAAKEKRVDPQLYPRLRGFTGLFKVKPENVENHLLVKRALAGLDTSGFKLKPADMAAYMLHNALK